MTAPRLADLEPVTRGIIAAALAAQKAAAAGSADYIRTGVAVPPAGHGSPDGGRVPARRRPKGSGTA
jgi:hypothetical protein